MLEIDKSRGIYCWFGRWGGRPVERMGDRECREFSEDITTHLPSIWLECGMKYQGFVYDWDLRVLYTGVDLCSCGEGNMRYTAKQRILRKAPNQEKGTWIEIENRILRKWGDL